MVDYLLDGGYYSNSIEMKESKYDGVAAIRFLNNRDIPFLIYYCVDENPNLEISNLYELFKENGDRVLFIIRALI